MGDWVRVRVKSRPRESSRAPGHSWLSSVSTFVFHFYVDTKTKTKKSSPLMRTKPFE